MVIGLTGEKLGGKDTVADYLVSRYNAYHARHSHILDEILSILNIPVSRRNEIDLGMMIRRVFGDGTLGRALKNRVQKYMDNHELIVINGIRFLDELKNTLDLGGVLVYITAPEDIRYRRFLGRHEKVDDARHTMEEFRATEQEPTEVGIPALGAQASYRIDNIGSLEDLHQKVDEIIIKILNPS